MGAKKMQLLIDIKNSYGILFVITFILACSTKINFETFVFLL